MEYFLKKKKRSPTFIRDIRVGYFSLMKHFGFIDVNRTVITFMVDVSFSSGSSKSSTKDLLLKVTTFE